MPPETFMSDGGKHFNNTEVTEFCSSLGTKRHVVSAYSPWVNGLVEGTNKLLLFILARLCAPEIGEDGWQSTTWESLPKAWPDHFEKAIKTLNWRILPALKFSPKELLLGHVVNSVPTSLEASSSLLVPKDVDIHMAYVAQQRLDGYDEAVRHAIQRKAVFDRKVLKSRDGVVEFKKGDLVQVYRSDLAYTVSNDRKLTPMWSTPRRIVERLLNSYRLETTEGIALPGEFSARRLRLFIPREGTELFRQQKEVTGEGEDVREDTSMEEDRTQLDSDLDSEVEEQVEGEKVEGFFYDKDDEEIEGDEGSVGDRVANRRRGRRHIGGG